MSVLLGLLLLSAAVLKTYQLATEPVLGASLLESRWFLVLVIQFELLLGLWLWSGLFPRAGWWASLVTFAVFAVVAIGKVVGGEASGGCFGGMVTRPQVALSLDVSAILALWWCRVSQVACECARSGASFLRTQGISNTTSNVGKIRRAHAGFVGVWLTTGAVLAFFAVRGVRIGEFAHIGERIGDLIIVEPDRMVHQPFELGRFIDIGGDLAHGRWFVVFYVDGCPRCELLIEQWSKMDPRSSPNSSDVRVAFVSVGEASTKALLPVDNIAKGNLSSDMQWLVPTPLVVSVSENRVLRAQAGSQSALDFHPPRGDGLLATSHVDERKE